jgi:hypothetical protein
MRPFGLMSRNHGSFCLFVDMSIFSTLGPMFRHVTMISTMEMVLLVGESVFSLQVLQEDRDFDTIRRGQRPELDRLDVGERHGRVISELSKVFELSGRRREMASDDR